MAKKKTAAGQAHRICNVVPSRHTENDWKFEDAVNSGILGAAAALPASKDLRAAWWKIGDQGSTGSCVGWGSTDGVMRYLLVKAGKLGQSELLSPRFNWMASKETDEYTTRPETFIEEAGTSLKAALDICRKYGVVLNTLLPFDIQTKMYLGNENTFFASAAQRKCSSYVNMMKNFSQWWTWIASNGPVLVALNVDASWNQAAQTQGMIDNFQPATVRGGHCVCLVGYRTDGRFIIRNSWGTSWGDQGFGYASEAYITAAFFNESYGVSL
jgi:C1A family cysteine protease